MSGHKRKEQQDVTVDAEAIARAVATLEAIDADRAVLASIDAELRTQLLIVAGRVSRPSPADKRKFFRAARRQKRADRRAADEAALDQTGIRAARRELVFATPPRLPIAPVRAGVDIDRALAEETEPAAAETARVSEPRLCYVCKSRYREVHFFYDQMCPTCAALNWHKRHQSADLGGRVALVSGGRVKIGYQAAIMLLRAGAHVIVTTRFPRDAAERYAREADFAEWSDRLDIHGLDLRHTPSVDFFARRLGETIPRLDFILNNACQTVRRPAGFYDHLMSGERRPLGELATGTRRLLGNYESFRAGETTLAEPSATALAARGTAVGLLDPAELSQLALHADDLERGPNLFPRGALDADLQQVDLRGRNSWRLPLADVSAIELLEVQLVNAVAPFILNARLKPLMLRQPSPDKHIVNVSAVEGQFYRRFKTDKHPHTNMAKAALNMMTRTSAADYVKDGIHMNSVDTGWVTDEDPREITLRKRAEHGFHPPLDIVDGAARICDPIFDGFNRGRHAWGLFFKDYKAADW